jgi:cardiolipin synthase
MSKLWTIPNLLTLLRLALTVVVPFVHGHWLAIVIVAAGLSDYADGAIARRWGMTSWIGGFMDGIADKVFMITTLFTLAWRGQLEAWWLPLLVSRDLAVGVVVLYLLVTRDWTSFPRMQSRWFGKAATACAFPLLVVAALHERPTMVVTALAMLTAALALAAAGDYLLQFVRELRSRAVGRLS